MDYYQDRIEGILKTLNTERRAEKRPVIGIVKKDIGYHQRETVLENTETWVPFERFDTWGGRETHACFAAKIVIPQEWAGEKVAVTLQTGATDIWNTDNPQFLVYINGEMICGHDMNHNEVILTEHAKAGECFDYRLYAYSNSAGKDVFLFLDTAIVRTEVEELYYNSKVPFEIASLLKQDDMRRTEYFQLLNEMCNLLDLRHPGNDEFFASIKKANAFLKQNLYSVNNVLAKSIRDTDVAQQVVVHSIGHTHIDVAWKWRLRQTREKVVRSFATVLYEMEQFPEYKFMSSQPQLYQFVKEDAPELYEKIKQRIAEGRWETEGSMWLEADCNLSSGESLIRQILYGKRFFQEEFGTGDNQVLWLPDVFGYSAAMPQILQKSGIHYFMTTKIGWNEYNKIPYDTMLWKGIDGTEILTYFITTKDYITDPELYKKKTSETTYNGRQNPNQIMGTWQRYQNKDINKEVLTCFGHGDGGGGATIEMLEQSRRMEYGLPACPRVEQTFVADFFQQLEQRLEGKKVPKWCGELYLEFHRGTYTSMARNKKYNRHCEFGNQDAESFVAFCCMENKQYAYPRKDLKKAWELTLLNQFHDILPGSSIKEVYDDSKEQYEEVIALEEKMIADALTALSGSADSSSAEPQYITVYNNTSFERNDAVESNGIFLVYDGEEQLPCQFTAEGTTVWQPKAVPAKGYRTFTVKQENQSGKRQENAGSSFCAEKRTLETPFYSIQFNEAWEFVSLFDKRAERELMTGAGNVLVAFEDRPKEYDCWNIDPYYVEKSWKIQEVENACVTENGAIRTVLRVTKRFGESKIVQDMVFYTKSPRIDFKTAIDWKESQILLKTAFPLDIMAQKATYEIQYGNVERPTHTNTSWDQAKFEVCAHKWADLAEAGYGAALLNDCKYGYDIHENVMRLTLLKSGIFPNPVADREHHEFTYSLYPHEGDFREGGVIKEAYLLNCPMYERRTVNAPAALCKSYFYGLPENVVLETVKLAEENEDIILRLYESFGKRTRAELSVSTEIKEAWECDLLEQPEHKLDKKDDKLQLSLKPYEIKTVRISQMH